MAANGVTGPVMRRGRQALAVSYLALSITLFVLVVAVSSLGDTHAGDPIVVMELRGPESPHSVTRVHISAVSGQQSSRSVAHIAVPISPAQEIIPEVNSDSALVVDPALIENTPAGPLPRIAVNGMTPMRAYAPGMVNGEQPRIAIVVGGLGISAEATEAALKELPSGVTLAFAPYAADVQHWVAQARKQGHEILLEIPMEPYGLPTSDLGQYTLRSSAAENANTERIVWALTRFSGYAGATNLLGSRFLADPDALGPVLKFLSRRGLMFFDNGAAMHSVVPDVATRVHIPFLQSDEAIDKTQTATEIDHRLSALESMAHSHGKASGSAQVSSLTVERLRSWAEGLSGRGFVLAPASAIVAQSN